MGARSLLFVPGNRPERFAKALQSGADAVIIDLEDAVPVTAKDEARAGVAAWLSAEHPVYVRVNGHDSEWHEEDMRAIAGKDGLRGIFLPKAQDPKRVAETAARLTGSVSLVPIIESAQGLWNALDMARCARVERLGFGHLDFQRDLGIDGEGDEILFARSHLVFTSRLAGVGAPLDGITANLEDEAKLRADVERARRLGFGGKLCIHPKQVGPVNEGFMPSQKDVEWARKIVGATESAGGAVRVGGEMVDAPVVARAQQILKLAGS